MDHSTPRRIRCRTGACRRLVLAPLVLAGLLAGGCVSSGTLRLADTAASPPRNPAYATLYAAAGADTGTDVEPTVVEPAVVGYPPPRDPLMPFNRAMFAFNDVAYRYVLIPLGRGYVRITPEPVRESIGNFFSNLRTPISAVNHLFQGEPKPAGRSLLRFGINTTIGLLGLFDPASTIGFEPEKTTFDDTLARYGSGQGVYLVLPLIGPSDTRDAAGLVVDYFLNPVHYLADGNDERLLRASDTFQQFAPTGDEYETIRAKAEDPYIFFRNLYWQGVRRDLEY